MMPSATVQFNYVAPIVWEQTSSFISPCDCIHVWQIDALSEFEALTRLSALLNEAERERAYRYHHQKDRQLFITGRAALRILVGKYLKKEPRDIEFAEGINKKPFLKNAPQLCYNTSHSENCILIAFANSEIGIDVERSDTALDYHDIVQANFSKEEIACIKKAKKPSPTFYMLWTRKEALVKATGKGLPNDLSTIPSLDGTHTIGSEINNAATPWIVSSFTVKNKWMGSVAYNPGIKTVRFLEMPLWL